MQNITLQREQYSSGAPWESIVGYSRAVRTGPFIAVTGCAAIGPDGELVGEGDAYVQAARCIEIIGEALDKADAGLADVVRTRIFVTDIDRWEEVARAHREAFGEIMPATTMVEVSRLIDPRMLVEIEADAVVAED
jgi:enamine deaminase RidA (YjgF/YER057c/UK114 family)